MVSPNLGLLMNTTLSVNRVFAENLAGLGFLYSVSYMKSIPTHEKLFAVGKSDPNATANLIVSWVRLALGWRVHRIHNIIYSGVYVFQPNRIW